MKLALAITTIITPLLLKRFIKVNLITAAFIGAHFYKLAVGTR